MVCTIESMASKRGDFTLNITEDAVFTPATDTALPNTKNIHTHVNVTESDMATPNQSIHSPSTQKSEPIIEDENKSHHIVYATFEKK